MLLVFAFSITPKKLLHDLVANHKDVKIQTTKTGNDLPQLSKAGFHCQCDQLVVQTPFLYKAVTFSLVLPVKAVSRQARPATPIYYPSHSVSFLRGPPVLSAAGC